MRAWYFTEMPYPHLPPFDQLASIRVSLPAKHFDPKIGADLYNRYLDEYIIAANPKQVAQVKANPKTIGWFVGQVMKSSGGKANPAAVNEILTKKLGL